MRRMSACNVHAVYVGAAITPGACQASIHQISLRELSLAIRSAPESLHSIHGKYSLFDTLAELNDRQGFLRDGKPVLPTFLPLAGCFEVSTRGQVLSPRTLILHFHLMPVPAMFHASVVPQSLTEFFLHGGLQVIDVPFALGTDDGVAEYAHHAASSVEMLTDDYVHVIIILTDHTSNDTGDLFLGLDETECMAVGIVDEVSAVFLKFLHLLILCKGFGHSVLAIQQVPQRISTIHCCLRSHSSVRHPRKSGSSDLYKCL